MSDIHPNDIERIRQHAKEIYCAKIAGGLIKNGFMAKEAMENSLKEAESFHQLASQFCRQL